MTLWKHVAAGGVTAPFAALLVFSFPGSRVSGMELVAGYILAGALTSLLCGGLLKLQERRSASRPQTHTRGLVLLACLGAAAVMVAAALVEAGMRSAHVPRGVLSGLPLFLALLGFWNCFSLMYGEWQRSQSLALQTKSRLHGLQAQIQPHFFFNTLNTVSALIPEQPAEAQAVIQRLAGLFRKSLTTPNSSTVPLDQEIELTREYLEIEKARFGARLRYTLPDSSQAAGWQIPALTLQPLVENAVRHGIARLTQGGEVEVTLACEENGFELQISNPVEDPRDIELDRLVREGHSLQLIVDRLQLMYNRRARITVELNGQFRIRIRIPGRRH